MFDGKHIATFLLGAAAGLAAHKYMSMTDEEKQKMSENLKAKAQGLQNDAEAAADKAKDYFNELKEKGSDALKEHFPQAEEMLNNLFGKKTETPSV
jgi:oligoendopeptidase F